MDRYRVKPGKNVNLQELDPDENNEFSGTKTAGLEKLAKLTKRLGELQEVLYAEHKQKILIVFQARDAGGKDGTIRSIFCDTNPQGIRVTSFKAPTPLELDHDYLWRIHQQTPGKGEMVIFNRSHYEDVLVVRVHDIVPKTIWEKRYSHIRHFEEILAEEGTTIIKFYLNISKEEQKKRFQERLDDPLKIWKFNPADLKERALWDAYTQAYEDAINQTSTNFAPWYVIPSNKNWYRNLCIAEILVKTLEELNMSYPATQPGMNKITIE